MPLVKLDKLISLSRERNYVIPAFNTTNLEMTLAIMEGLNDSGVPGIVQIAPTNVKLSDFNYISEIVRIAEKSLDIPVCLHLDHGKSFEDIKNAVQAGFTSVMIDGASLNFEENIALTKKVVDYCSCYGIPVEAELGAIGGKEDADTAEEENKTDPVLVKEFVERSGCDLLAVSVGNIHGLGNEPVIDLKLLGKIAKESSVPLVLHGGSGIDIATIKKMKQYNVVKINIASDLRRKFIQTVGHFYEEDRNEHNLVKVLLEAKKAVREEVIVKSQQINS